MKNIILIVGGMGSGKDTAGEYISNNYNLPFYNISEGLKLLAKQRGISSSRDNLIKLGKEVGEKFGDDFLARNLVETIKENTFIILGARQLGQLDYLFKNTNCFSIGINSHKGIRFERVLKRFKSGEYSYDDFLRQEFKDNFSGPQKVEECIKKCNNIITNNSTLEEFLKQLDILSNKITFLGK